MNIDFTKMQGIGNDFIVINCLENQFPEADLPKIAQVLNDRRFGIGGDGIVLVLPSSKHDMQMRMLNPDGSEAEMCGNGIRCFARYVRDNNLTDKSSLRVETLAGPIGIELVDIAFIRLDCHHPAILSDDSTHQQREETDVGTDIDRDIPRLKNCPDEADLVLEPILLFHQHIRRDQVEGVGHRDADAIGKGEGDARLKHGPGSGAALNSGHAVAAYRVIGVAHCLRL